MESELAWAISGILVALLGVSVVTITTLLRRNNRSNHGNPNLATIEALCKQQVQALSSIEHKLDGALLLLTEVRTSQVGKGG